MNIYVIIMSDIDGDCDVCILDKAGWDLLDNERAFCEQLHDGDPPSFPRLAEPGLKELFTLIRENNWVVVEAETGPIY